jgi:hypothetical protein
LPRLQTAGLDFTGDGIRNLAVHRLTPFLAAGE